jgi:hypothetical protein
MVAGEWPARAVGAMQSWSKPDHQQPVARAAERRDRPAVIRRMRAGDGGQMTRQARAEPAARLERRARKNPDPFQRALNCASSVDPRMAVIEELPPFTVCVTSSK